MKSYKQYERRSMGFSDSARLIWASGECGFINFNQDASYSAYIVDEDADIGEHYSLVAKGDGILLIYDDIGKVFEDRARSWKIFRSGEMGLIIQMIERY